MNTIQTLLNNAKTTGITYKEYRKVVAHHVTSKTTTGAKQTNTINQKIKFFLRGLDDIFRLPM